MNHLSGCLHERLIARKHGAPERLAVPHYHQHNTDGFEYVDARFSCLLPLRLHVDHIALSPPHRFCPRKISLVGQKRRNTSIVRAREQTNVKTATAAYCHNTGAHLQEKTP